MDQRYLSAMPWIESRLKRERRRNAIGRKANAEDTFRKKLKEINQMFKKGPHSQKVFFAELKTAIDFFADWKETFLGVLERVPTSKPPLSKSGSKICTRRYPPKGGFDPKTGFPVGARLFRHPDAYPMLSGTDLVYLQEFNSNFHALYIRFERSEDRIFLVVWDETRSRTPTPKYLEAQRACLSGLISYIGTPSDTRLLNIMDFYKRNKTLFHPAW